MIKGGKLLGCLVFIGAMFMLFFVLWGFTVSPFLGIIMVVGVFWGAIAIDKSLNKNKTNEKNEKINKLHNMQKLLKDFTVSQKYQSYDLKSSILLDEERKKVCFIFADTNKTETYDYKDILESEIMEDGKTVTNTSRSSQIGGAIVGGVLAGGAGAVIGGLSGKKSSEKEINKIDLKVIVNNTKSPIKLINFLTADDIDFNGKPFPIKKDSPKYKSAMSSINHWHSLLGLLIKQTDSEDTGNTKNNKLNENINLSVADELNKLLQLKKEGILTEEEFNQQKQKILSS